jgi:putative ABC transport system substrate-binding protein
LRALAQELVTLPIEVLVTSAAPATQAAQAVSQTLPIVFLNSADPIELGFTTSLDHPSGNLTGLSDADRAYSEARVHLIQQLVPQLTRLSVLWEASNPGNALQWRQTQAAADAVGLAVDSWAVGSSEAIDQAFAAATAETGTALIVIGGPLTVANSQRIVAGANQLHLPALYPNRGFIGLGGLLFYGANILALARRGATYVDALLNGATPAELPIEHQDPPDLVINLKTAAELGLAIPPAVLEQATEVIQ